MATTAVLGGTVAKYVSTAKAQDSATVAKWGIEMKVWGNLFGERYVAGEFENSTPTVGASGITVSSSSAGTRLVAPGTQGDTINFSITGEAEVATRMYLNVQTKNIFLLPGTYMVMEPFVNQEDFDDWNGQVYQISGTEYQLVAGTVSYVEGQYYRVSETLTFEYDFGYSKADDDDTVFQDRPDYYYPVRYGAKGFDLNLNNGYSDGLYENIRRLCNLVRGKTGDNKSDTLAHEDIDIKIKEDGTLLFHVVADYPATMPFNMLGSMEWFWELSEDKNSNSSKADAILGYLSSGKRLAILSDEKLIQLTCEDSGLVRRADDTTKTQWPIACLKTEFNIDCTLEQID